MTVLSPELSNELEKAGLSPHDDPTFALIGRRRPGRVVIMHGAQAEILWFPGTGAGVQETFDLTRDLNLRPVAGDWVAVEDGRIVEVGRRRTALLRPDPNGRDTQVLGANIDTVMIVLPIDRPLNLKVLERLQVMAWDSGAEPVLVMTKTDQCPDPDAAIADAAQVAFGVPVIVTSSVDGTGLGEVRDRLRPGTTTTMLGPSGAGKTSLLNALEQRAEAVRELGVGGQGRHTTTTRRLYPTSGGGVLLDIPGIRSLDLMASDEAVEEIFDDVRELAQDCRFADCRHSGDAGCAVEAAVSAGDLPQRRLDSWHAIQRERAYQERRQDPAAMAEQRKAWKQMSKSIRRR